MQAKRLSCSCVAGLCLLVLLLSGCSKSGPNQSSQTAPSQSSAASGNTSGSALTNPCSLITQAEVENALGAGGVMTPNHNPRTGMDECRLKPGAARDIYGILITVHPADGWEMVKKSFTESDKDAKQVPGLGDDAFVTRFIGYNVRKGNRYVQVAGDMQNDNAANDKATRYLAERAASRM